MKEGEERRQHPRHPCDRTYEGTLPEAAAPGAAVFRCHAINASEGGLMLETSRMLEVGQRITLSLKSRDRKRSVVAEVEVRWCKLYGEVFRAGVRFVSRHEDYVV